MWCDKHHKREDRGLVIGAHKRGTNLMFGKVTSNMTLIGTRAWESCKPEFKSWFQSITLANLFNLCKPQFH